MRLATRLVDVIMEPSDAAAGQFEEIMLSAEVDGWPLLSRLARSLQTAILLATAPAPWRSSAAAELLDDLERRDDRWTVCVTSLVIGTAYAWIDEPALATRTLGRAADVAGELGAPVLQAWAGLLRSTTGGRQGEPEVERQVANAVRAATGLGLLHTAEVVQAVTMRAGRATTGRPTEVTSSAEVPSSDRSSASCCDHTAMLGRILTCRARSRCAVATAPTSGSGIVDVARHEPRPPTTPRADH